MAQTAVSKAQAPDPAIKIEADRKMPEIDPGAVLINHEGYAYRSWQVRLPAGCIADDLKEPGLWRKVQGNPSTAMRKHDHLYLVSFDESWSADTIVSFASSTEVILTKPRLIAFVERTKPLLSDGVYAVQWAGTGYQVVRISDGQPVSNITLSEAQAEHDLRAQYPKKPS